MCRRERKHLHFKAGRLMSAPSRENRKEEQHWRAELAGTEQAESLQETAPLFAGQLIKKKKNFRRVCSLLAGVPVKN